MSDTPLPLPEGLRWIKLVCRLGRLAHDGADADDKPDLLPTAGKVRLASSPARLRVQESDGRWRSVSLDEREYTIRADGELVDTEGRVGVWIPDPASELLDPRPYTLVATVTPTVGERWAAKLTGENLPDVVDLVAHSETVAIPASAVPGLSSRIASVEGILAAGGTGTGSGIRDVSGAVTLPDDGPRVLEMYTVGPATINGESFAVDTALVARRTADGVWQVAVVADETWRAFGTTEPVEDTTPPNAGSLAVTGSGFVGSARTLTVSNASDDVALAALPYRFSIDGGLTYPAGWQASPSYTTAALTAGSYAPQVQVRDAASNVATATAAAFDVQEEVDAWGTVHSDNFNTAVAGSLVGRTLDEGGLAWQAPADAPNSMSALTASAEQTVTQGRGKLLIPAQSRFKMTARCYPTLFQRGIMFYFGVNSTTRLTTNNVAMGYSSGYRVEVWGTNATSLFALSAKADGSEQATLVTKTSGSGVGVPLNTWSTVTIELDGETLTVTVGVTVVAVYTLTGYTVPENAFLAFEPRGTCDDFSLRVQ